MLFTECYLMRKSFGVARQVLVAVCVFMPADRMCMRLVVVITVLCVLHCADCDCQQRPANSGCVSV
jgi:hypothetical protein